MTGVNPIKTHCVMISDTKTVHSKFFDKIPPVAMKRLRFDIEEMGTDDKDSKRIKGELNQNTPFLIASKTKEETMIQNQGRSANHHKEFRVAVTRLGEGIIKEHQRLLSNPRKVNNCNIFKKKFQKKNKKPYISLKKNRALNGNGLNAAFKIFCTLQLSYNMHKANELHTKFVRRNGEQNDGNKTLFLKKKGVIKKEESDSRKIINTTLTCKKNMNLSPKYNEDLSEKVKQTIGNNAVISNTITHISPLIKTQSNINNTVITHKKRNHFSPENSEDFSKKLKKTIDNNNMITNQINDFSPVTLKEIRRKFNIHKEARVQLVSLNENLITNYHLPAVKNSTKKCVSFDLAKEEAEISKNSTNKTKYCSLDPKKSIIKSISNKKECYVALSKLKNIPIVKPVKTHANMVSDTKIVHSKLKNGLKNRFHHISVACKRPTVDLKRLRFDFEKIDDDDDTESKRIKGKSNLNNPVLTTPKSKEEKIIQKQGKNANRQKEVRVVIRRLGEDIIKKHLSLLSNPRKMNNCNSMDAMKSSDSFSCASGIEYTKNGLNKITSINSNMISVHTQDLLQRKNGRNSKLHFNYPTKSSMCSVLPYSIDHSNILNIFKKKFDKKNRKSCTSLKKKPRGDENCLNTAFKIFCTLQLSYKIHKANELHTKFVRSTCKQNDF